MEPASLTDRYLENFLAVSAAYFGLVEESGDPGLSPEEEVAEAASPWGMAARCRACGGPLRDRM